MADAEREVDDVLAGNVLSVQELNDRIASVVQDTPALNGVRCIGEVTDLHQNSTALYFTLTDGDAELPCMLWANRYQKMDADLEDGTDVILVQNNPMDVVRLVKLSKASYRKMQENIVWAAGYNVFAIPLAAGVLAPIGILLSPAVGALLMSLSTVIVAINAQLLRRVDLSIPELPSGTPATDAQPAD